MSDARTLTQRAQAQTQANRFALLIRAVNAKLVEKIRKS
jgi:hypothetical protein